MKKSFTTKLLKVMSVCTIQAMLITTLCGVALSHPNYGQVLDREVTIQLVDVPFEDALKHLEKAAGVQFAYSIDQLEGEPNVSISVQNGTVRYVLEEVLTRRRIRYNVHETDAVITLQKIVPTADSKQSLREGINHDRHSDLFEITGTVTDAGTGAPMAGVNILVKGTTSGATTDSDGRYTLAAEEKDVLIFSFIGYSSVEVPVAGRGTIDIAMAEDVLNLGEVVVNAGYWEVKERERTGNISRVSEEEIARQPVNNPLHALQGRMPGVYIQQTTGMPGGAVKVEIRGRNSLRTDGNQPLYIVDGIPFHSASTSSAILNSAVQGGSPLAAINPSDIESIEILKDADATAIYGSRGANGVILITTKRGTAGKTSVNVNVNQGIGRVSKYMDLLNTPDYISMRKEAFANDGFWPLPSFLEFIAPDIFTFDTTRYTDWQKELIGGTASTTTAHISVSGGREKTSFLLSSGYYKEGTVFPGDAGFRRVSGSMSIQHTSDNNRFNTSVSANYTTNLNRLFPADLTREAVTLPPNMPALRDTLGNINWNWNNPFFRNPLTSTEKSYRTTTDNLIANVTTSYEILAGLNGKVSFGYTSTQVHEFSSEPLSAMNPASVQTGATASSLFGDSYVKTWIAEPQLHYTRQIGNGQLSFLVGGSFQGSEQEGETIQATGYTNDALLENIRAATGLSVLDVAHAAYKYSAVFSRINYNWAGKYILNLTGRRDGSSRFGPGKRFGNFGAVGAAWLFSEEPFVNRNGRFISFGKIRTSFGSTGSDAIGNYQYLNSYSPTMYPYNGNSGLVVTRLSNPDYSWETNRKFEVGIDLGILNDRIRIAASWFDNRSTDQLVGLPLPAIAGQSSVQFNLPATVQNKGWELLANTVNIRSGRFSWETGINLTIPQNVLMEFPDIEAFPAYNNIYQVGSSVFSKRTLTQMGVDPETGMYIFEDVNEDGNISTTNDATFNKEVAQKFFGGMNNGFTFAGFRLDLFIQFVKQDGYNYLLSYQSPGNMSNQPDIVLNRWQQPGDQAPIQRYSLLGAATGVFSNNKFSDNSISDASFIRLKNASLSWSLPSKWMKAARMQRCILYAQGQNLFTHTKYVGMDPETQNSIALPPLRMITFGTQLTFN